MKTLLTAISLLFVMSGAMGVELSDAKKKQQELQSLQQEIKKLKVELEKTEANKLEAVNALQQSESAILEANRFLSTLQQSQRLSQSQLNKIYSDMAKVKTHIKVNQLKLSELLKTRYRQGYFEPWRLLLSQQNLNTVQRDLQYYAYIAKAQQELGNQLRKQLLYLDQLAEKIRQKQLELDNVHSQKQQQKTVLEGEKHRKAIALTALSKDVNYKKTRLQRLKANERNLTTLVNRLNRIVQEAQRRQMQLAKQQTLAKKPSIASVKEQRKSEQGEKDHQSVPDRKSSGRGFIALKGSLRLPVKGKIIGRFGELREEGSVWKGLLIEAPLGQPIRVIADGQVVFAEWLRGFGNMVIVSHGDGYMSLYGQNESITKKVGDQVKAGEEIATVGDSGGAGDAGLYFEIRRHGHPQNPLQWASSV